MRHGLILAVVLTLAAAAPAAADQGQDPPSNHPGSRRDFLFGRPHGSIGVSGSWLLPRAGSDLFDFVTDQLTLDRDDFQAPGIGLQLGLIVTPRLEAVAGVEFHKSRAPSEFGRRQRRLVGRRRDVAGIFGRWRRRTHGRVAPAGVDRRARARRYVPAGFRESGSSFDGSLGPAGPFGPTCVVSP